MLYLVGHLDDITVFYDTGIKQLMITIEDAMSVNSDTLVALQKIHRDYPEEIHFVGQYLASNEEWLASFASEEHLRHLLECDLLADHVKRTIKAELSERLKARLGYVYLLKADNGLYKIGQAKVVDRRIAQLAVSLPYELKLEAAIETVRYKELEPELHKHFSVKRKRGEWFELNEADVEYIKGLEHD